MNIKKDIDKQKNNIIKLSDFPYEDIDSADEIFYKIGEEFSIIKTRRINKGVCCIIRKPSNLHKYLEA